jgi:hypothetical protein
MFPLEHYHTATLMSSKHLIRGAAAAFLLASSIANANVVSYDFTANITSVTEKDLTTGQFVTMPSSSFVGTPISVGQTLDGSFFYDTNTPLNTYQPPAQTSGSYQLYSGPFTNSGISYSIKGSGVQLAPGQVAYSNLVQVADNASSYTGSDVFSLGDTYFEGSTYMRGASILLSDFSGKVFNSSSIPQSLNFGDFSYGSFNSNWYRIADGGFMTFTANVATLTPHADAPEPSALLLMVLGLGSLALLRRKQG